MITFGDLYEEILSLEQAIDRMEVDIDNTSCDSIAKCILPTELENIQWKYYNLLTTDIEFEKLNFVTIVDSIQKCIDCNVLSEDVSDIAHAPYDIASSCGTKNRQITLEDIEKIIVTEGTTTATDYEFTKNAMPYTILTRAEEKYVVTWDSLRQGISIKGFHQIPGNPVKNFGNICNVKVVLNSVGQNKFGTTEINACKALLVTPTPMANSAPLYNAVDGNLSTYPRVDKSTEETVVEIIFQFFA